MLLFPLCISSEARNEEILYQRIAQKGWYDYSRNKKKKKRKNSFRQVLIDRTISSHSMCQSTGHHLGSICNNCFSAAKFQVQCSVRRPSVRGTRKKKKKKKWKKEKKRRKKKQKPRQKRRKKQKQKKKYKLLFRRIAFDFTLYF